MSQTIRVSHVSGHRFSVDIRSHRLTVDQPHAAPALEGGPTPVELFVAALAACAAHSAQLVLTRVDPHASVTATCEYEMSEAPPARVKSVRIAILLPFELSAERVASIRRAVELCSVQQSLRDQPEVAVTLHTDAVAAAERP
jgi:uncharacterized OsmC-like protein